MWHHAAYAHHVYHHAASPEGHWLAHTVISALIHGLIYGAIFHLAAWALARSCWWRRWASWSSEEGGGCGTDAESRSGPALRAAGVVHAPVSEKSGFRGCRPGRHGRPAGRRPSLRPGTRRGIPDLCAVLDHGSAANIRDPAVAGPCPPARGQGQPCGESVRREGTIRGRQSAKRRHARRIVELFPG